MKSSRHLGPAVLLLLSLAATPVPAATAREAAELSLERAIELALEHNHRLLADEAAVGAAEAEIDAAKASRLPNLDLVAGFQHTDNPVAVFGNRLRQGTFSEEDFALSRLNGPDALDNHTLQLVASLPLWTGGRIANAIAAAESGREAADAQRERVRQEVVHRVIEAYSAAVLAGLELEATTEALETAEAQLKLARDLFESGLVVESDPLLAEVRVSELRELLIRAETRVRRSRAALNLAIGRALEEPLTLPVDVASDVTPVGDLETLQQSARERRPDLLAARAQVTVAESRLALARAGRRPELGLQAAWETNDSDFFAANPDNYSVGLALRVPLFDGGSTKAAAAGAEQQVRRARETVELVAQQVELEVLELHAETRAAAQRLVQARRGLDLAERSLAIVQDRYREGLATLPELLEAESSLTGSRLNEVAARRDQLLTRAGLELATGGLGSDDDEETSP